MVTKTSTQKGFALLLVMFMMFAIMSIVTAAALVSLTSGKTISKYDLGEKAYEAAETGVEDALIRWQRGYANYGQKLIVSGTADTELDAHVTLEDAASATAGPTCSGVKAITSVGIYKHYIRSVRVCIATDGSVQYWTEIPYPDAGTKYYPLP